ncbi:MAG: 50S ribosomal protein L7/L12 [Candidatus Mesenet longicola]|uniref:50S ribosomal protein L7/L12 n=1 Tax=Candidatus Mesenet longicola TaxID=1892558 RepID=A0A8J3MMK7_9RICK|nr:MAG: 50S ribosomal protein L7/L12 [Candidatus Mesenet longicola]GHM59282.1 MAG: 50S ribosomal protein L7/L12 [Candidatus Mesenet longicola]
MNSEINEKSSLLEQILSLDLLQAAELAKELENKLGLPLMGSYAHSTQSSVESGSEAPIVEKTEYSVILKEFGSDKKVSIIKAIREIKVSYNQGELTLKGAMDFIGSLPKAVVSNTSKEEAEKIKKMLIDAGASIVELE